MRAAGYGTFYASKNGKFFRMKHGSRDGGTLTGRESEIVGWMSAGKSNCEIAAILNISTATVKKHAENIFRKLNVTNRTAAATVWLQRGE
jgi:DNA-binding NarL/FixJ family response regulator